MSLCKGAARISVRDGGGCGFSDKLYNVLFDEIFWPAKSLPTFTKWYAARRTVVCPDMGCLP